MKPDVAFRCRVCGREWKKEEILQMLEGKTGIARERTIAKLWRDHLLLHMKPTTVYFVFLGGIKRVRKYLEVDEEWLEQI